MRTLTIDLKKAMAVLTDWHEDEEADRPKARSYARRLIARLRKAAAPTEHPKAVVISLHGGIVDSVFVNDESFRGARFVVTESPKYEGRGNEVSLQDSELKGEIVYQTGEISLPSEAIVAAASKAADQYQEQED